MSISQAISMLNCFCNHISYTGYAYHIFKLAILNKPGLLK